MEGRGVLLIGALAFVALVVIVAFFMSRGTAPYVPMTVVSTSTTAVTSIYTSTISPARGTVTTTVPTSATAPEQRLAGDLDLFRNVYAIALTYNATEPGSPYENGSNATFYKFYGNVSFGTYYTIQDFTLPVVVYGLGGRQVVCATLPYPVMSAATSCAVENVSFPNMADFMSLNASAYSNVSYSGTGIVNGDACDRFSASVSQGEAGRLTGNTTGGGFSASMCINTAYGYPDYFQIRGPGVGPYSITYVGASQQVSSLYLQPPSDFSVANATCSESLIRFTMTPFYDFSNPSFLLSGATLNLSSLDFQDAAAAAEVSYLTTGSWGSTVKNLVNGSSQANSSVRNALVNPYIPGYGNYSSQELLNRGAANMSYGVLDYQNGSVYTTLPGTYAAMNSYPVTLPVGGLITALGFSLCDSAGCQVVLTC